MDFLALLLLLGAYLGLASRRVRAAVRRFAHNKRHGLLLVVSLLLPLLLVRLPAAAAAPLPFVQDAGVMLLYLLVPAAATLYRPAGARPLHPLDVLAILALWFPVEFGWLPRADAQLAVGVTLPVPLLTAIVLGLVCFVVLRPLPDIGYTFTLRRADWGAIGRALGAYLLVALPLGLATRFLVIDLAPFDAGRWLLAWPLGYLFTALPEELLFRGGIQNQLHGRLRREWLALAVAAVVFGLSHLNNATPGYPEPNWMYAVMAALAGVAYGWTWRRTGKITASAVVHATVNFVWGLLLSG